MHKLWISLSLLLLSLPASAGNYILGVENLAYQPFYETKQGQYQGFARELFDLYVSKSSDSIEYDPLPVKRLLNDLLRGKIDLKFPDNPYWAQDQKAGLTLLYSAPIVTATDGVVVSTSRGSIPVSELKKLGIIRGFSPFIFNADIAKGTIKVQEATSYDSLFKMLNSKRIDGVYINKELFHYMEKSGAVAKGAFLFSDSLPNNTTEFKLSTLKHPQMLQSFNAFMQQNRPAIEALKGKYDLH